MHFPRNRKNKDELRFKQGGKLHFTYGKKQFSKYISLICLKLHTIQYKQIELHAII